MSASDLRPVFRMTFDVPRTYHVQVVFAAKDADTAAEMASAMAEDSDFLHQLVNEVTDNYTDDDCDTWDDLTPTDYAVTPCRQVADWCEDWEEDQKEDEEEDAASE